MPNNTYFVYTGLPEKWRAKKLGPSLTVEFVAQGAIEDPGKPRNGKSANHSTIKVTFVSPEDGFAAARISMDVGELSDGSNTSHSGGTSIKYAPGELCVKLLPYSTNTTSSTYSPEIAVLGTRTLGDFLDVAVAARMLPFKFLDLPTAYKGCRDFMFVLLHFSCPSAY